MARFEDKTVFITGVARGQGRSHAREFAAHGANVVGIDICSDIESVPYPLASEQDLRDTNAMVDDLGGKSLFKRVDVRNADEVRAVVADANERFGVIDVLVANAGIISYATSWEMSAAQWHDTLETNVTGVWHAVQAVLPGMMAARSGSIVLVSSTAGLRGTTNSSAYTASKHAVVGLMRTLAKELAPFGIRANCVHPTAVDTPMIENDATYRLFRPDLDSPTRADTVDAFVQANLLRVPWVEPVDISHAVCWLASDEARYVTGATLPVDAGSLAR